MKTGDTTVGTVCYPWHKHTNVVTSEVSHFSEQISYLYMLLPVISNTIWCKNNKKSFWAKTENNWSIANTSRIGRFYGEMVSHTLNTLALVKSSENWLKFFFEFCLNHHQSMHILNVSATVRKGTRQGFTCTFCSLFFCITQVFWLVQVRIIP